MTATAERIAGVNSRTLPLILITLAASAIFIGPLVRREVFTFRDHSDYFQPLRYETAHHLKRGVLPLWNAYNASGEPWLANPQTGVFYPPSWIFVALPFDLAYMLFLLFHLIVLGWSFFFLLERWVPPSVAMVGAIGAVACGPIVSLLDVSNNLCTIAWLPLVVFCAVERSMPLPRWHVAGDAAVLTLAFLGGEPFFAALGAMLYASILIVAAIRQRRHDLWKRTVAAAVLAFGFSAVQLLPFIELTSRSDRSVGLSRAEIVRDSMHPRDWIRTAIPPQLQSSGYDPALSQHFIPVVYCGIFLVACAVIGLTLLLDPKRRGLVIWSLAILLFSILIASGEHIDLIEALLVAAPVTPFRFPSRLVPIGALAILALATLGWNRVRPARRWVDLIAVLVVLADLLPRSAPLHVSAPFDPHRVPYDRSIGRIAKIVRLPWASDEFRAARVARERTAWISGYLNLYDARFDVSTAAPLASADYTRIHNKAISGGRGDLIRELSIGYVLADRPEMPGHKAVARAGSVIVFESSRIIPMATFWSRARRVASAGEALATLDTPDPLPMAVAGPVPPELARASLVGRPAETLAFDPSHAHVFVRAPSAGIVVLTQQDAPGWSVTVDGAPAPKLLARGLFRAVAVSAGEHRIVWSYRPRSLLIGAVLTVASLFIACAAVFRARRRRESALVDGEPMSMTKLNG